MVTYEFKDLNTGKITPEEYFMNDYEEEIHEPEQVHTSTKQPHGILYAKRKKADLNKVTENQCHHLIEIQRNEFSKIVTKN